MVCSVSILMKRCCSVVEEAGRVCWWVVLVVVARNMCVERVSLSTRGTAIRTLGLNNLLNTIGAIHTVKSHLLMVSRDVSSAGCIR